MAETMKDPENRWMSRNAAAAHLGIGTSTLDRLVAAGRIRKYTATGLSPRYDRRELDAYVTDEAGETS